MPKFLNKKAFVKAKAEGLNNTEAALKAGSKNREAAKVAGHVLSHDESIQHDLSIELERADINVQRPLKRIREALDADKIDFKTGEVFADHSTRLKASAMALDLLGVKNAKTSEPNPTQNKELLDAINNNVDEVELQKLVFRKT
jgi:hypothetical protein